MCVKLCKYNYYCINLLCINIFAIMAVDLLFSLQKNYIVLSRYVALY